MEFEVAIIMKRMYVVHMSANNDRINKDDLIQVSFRAMLFHTAHEKHKKTLSLKLLCLN